MKLLDLFESSPTDNPNFQRWFGDSKVVDVKGQPLRVYHGTSRTFDSFSESDAEAGYYFSNDPSVSDGYAFNRHDDEGDAQTYAVYLSLQNPMVVDYQTEVAKWNADDVRMNGTNAHTAARTKSAENSNFFAELVDDLIDHAMHLGHDGLVLTDIRDGWNLGGSLATTYIAFQPNQIKSVFNNGTFDDTAKLSEDAPTDNPNFKRWFGNSVVVKDDGQPMIVYHGTNNEFDTFNGMVWASTHHELPQDYAAMRAEFYGGAANIIPLYMRLEKPFNADLLPKTVTISDMFNAMLEQSGVNLDSIPDHLRDTIQSYWDIVETGRRTEESGPHYDRHNFWNQPRDYFGSRGASCIRLAFKELGFDGIQMLEDGEITYGVFYSHHVKSIFNSGGYGDTGNISEADDLLELQMRYNSDVGPAGHNMIVAFRGNVWMLGDMSDIPQEVVYDVASSLGLQDAENMDEQDLENELGEITDNRPEVIYGNVYQGVLHLRSSVALSPATSPMIKKLVQQLGLKAVEMDDVTFSGDEDSYYYPPNELQGKIPEIMYHGTSSEHLNRIAKVGLRPNKPSNWEKQGITHEDLIFASPTLQGSVFHANNASGMQHDPEDNIMDPDDAFPVIIAFKVPDPNLVEPDYDVASATMGRTDKADHLGYTNKTNYATYSNADDVVANNPEGRTWKSAGAFAYRGWIPPNHIMKVYSNFFDGGPMDSEIDSGSAWSGTMAQFYEEYEDRRNEYYGYDEDEDDY